MRTGLALLALVILGGCATGRPPDGTSTFALRLRPGDDLRLKLEDFAKQRKLQAGYVITCAGSLKTAAIRFADRPDATILTGPFEIVSLTGTLSPDGPHLHVSVADRDGRTTGGHLAEGSIIYTTAEIVLGELRGTRFRRVTDPATGFKELEVGSEPP